MTVSEFKVILEKNKKKLILSKCYLSEEKANLKLRSSYSYGDMDERGTYVLRKEFSSKSFNRTLAFLDRFCTKH